ncbi:MAG: hypothetical protein VKJ64_16090, partial [Leptolyngbyaceae bacterium]|nr:hypothetical protein [Leptolyngbyaceae bacterium]
MGNRFNQSLIHQPLAYLLLTPMMAIALGLGCDREMVMAQSPPMPVMPPTDHDGAIELDSEGNTEPTVINPDENTEDLGLEVESPLDSDLGSESLDGDGLNDGGINGDAVDDLDAGSDRPHLDDPDPQPDNDINNAIDENISPILEQLEPIDPGDLDLNDLDSSDLDASDLDPSDLDPSDIETDTDFNLDGRQIDDLNEAIGEDLVPPLIDFLQNGIELQVEPPTTGPNP